MNIEVIKYELVNKLLSTTDESLLEQVYAIFKKSDKKNDGLTIAQYNSELKAAETRMKNGKYTTHDEIELESKEW